MIQLIVNSMAKLNRIQEELLSLAQKKREVLIQGDVEQLSSIVQEEAKLVKQLGKIENERVEHVQAFLQQQQVNKQDITLAELVELLPASAEKEQLQDQAGQLQRKVEELQGINQLNTKLITDSLHFIQHSLDILTDQQAAQVNYQRPLGSQNQNKSTAGRRSIFDTKA